MRELSFVWTTFKFNFCELNRNKVLHSGDSSIILKHCWTSCWLVFYLRNSSPVWPTPWPKAVNSISVRDWIQEIPKAFLNNMTAVKHPLNCSYRLFPYFWSDRIGSKTNPLSIWPFLWNQSVSVDRIPRDSCNYLERHRPADLPSFLPLLNSTGQPVQNVSLNIYC